MLQEGAALLAIITLPTMALFFRWSFGLDGWEARPIDVALQVGQVQVLPLLLGLVLRRWRPRLADRLRTALEPLANSLLILLVVVLLLKVGPSLWTFLSGNLVALIAMVLMALAPLLIGSLEGASLSTSGGPRAMVGLPGTGLSWSVKHTADQPVAMPRMARNHISEPAETRAQRSGIKHCYSTSRQGTLEW